MKAKHNPQQIDLYTAILDAGQPIYRKRVYNGKRPELREPATLKWLFKTMAMLFKCLFLIYSNKLQQARAKW